MLGLDVMEIGNEGKVVAAVVLERAEQILAAGRSGNGHASSLEGIPSFVVYRQAKEICMLEVRQATFLTNATRFSRHRFKMYLYNGEDGCKRYAERQTRLAQVG